uniref:Uncharacterized protein n=1 Tax=Megaselia scalaris TaxID=36166 RepID=T1GEF4_MEGSC
MESNSQRKNLYLLRNFIRLLLLEKMVKDAMDLA